MCNVVATQSSINDTSVDSTALWSSGLTVFGFCVLLGDGTVCRIDRLAFAIK